MRMNYGVTHETVKSVTAAGGPGRCHASGGSSRAGVGYWSRGFVNGNRTPFGSRPDLARVVGGRRGNLGCDKYLSVLILNLNDRSAGWAGSVGRRGRRSAQIGQVPYACPGRVAYWSITSCTPDSDRSHRVGPVPHPSSACGPCQRRTPST